MRHELVNDSTGEWLLETIWHCMQGSTMMEFSGHYLVADAHAPSNPGDDELIKGLGIPLQPPPPPPPHVTVPIGLTSLGMASTRSRRSVGDSGAGCSS